MCFYVFVRSFIAQSIGYLPGPGDLRVGIGLLFGSGELGGRGVPRSRGQGLWSNVKKC